MLQTVMRPSIDMSRKVLPAYSKTWPVPPAVPILAMIARITSLALTPAPSPPLTLISMFLAGAWIRVWVAKHVLDLGGADAEGERAHRAMRGGVAVAADDGHAGLAQALLRPDDVDDALVEAVDREIGDAELPHIALEGVDLELRVGIVDAGDADLAVGGRNVVIGDGHRRVGPAHLAPGKLQAFEGLRRRDLVDQVQIDIDQVGALALRGHDMALPDLVEQRARCGHDSDSSD